MAWCDASKRSLATSVAGFFIALIAAGRACASEPPSVEQARAALRRSVDFFVDEVAVQGGYVWQYSEDLTRREGELPANHTRIWVQPPGTPTVGLALLRAFEVTGDQAYLDAAKAAGEALANGQMRSGGWGYYVEFDPQRRADYGYRRGGGDNATRDLTILDDDTTQAALSFLMKLDSACQFRDQHIHEVVVYALDHLLAAQYPNGGWPQRFKSPPATKHPVLKANYPEAWPRTYVAKGYYDAYTVNGQVVPDMLRLLFEAERIYGEPRFRAAAKKTGDFVLLAQMPPPQPAWAQQYNFQMQPCWARRFEPPAIAGRESEAVMEALLMLYRETGERKYLEPLPPAIEYFRSSLLADGRLARFYELETNRPLFFDREYNLTYDDSDLPTHYRFRTGSRLDKIEAAYKALLNAGMQTRKSQDRASAKQKKKLSAAASRVCDGLDERGAWVEAGRLRKFGDDDPTTHIIKSRTFVANVEILCKFIEAHQ